MKLFARYIVLSCALVITCLCSLHTYFNTSLDNQHRDTAVIPTQTANSTDLNRLLDYYGKSPCYQSSVRTNPFVEGPRGYPTAAPGKQLGSCVKVHCSPVGLPTTVLASYQGSGNTWLRHLIHELTGVHTGSVYTDDKVLQASGFLGEGWRNQSVVAVKTHGYYRGNNVSEVYDRGILLVRNPYQALISEFNRRKGHGHVALAEQDLFYSYKWTNFVSRGMVDWYSVTKSWLRIPSFCLHIIQYEDLVKDTYTELLKLAVFLGVNRTYLTPEHLQCVLKSSTGKFKRQKRPVNLSVFTKEMNSSIQGYAKDVKFVAWNKKKVQLKYFGDDIHDVR